MRIWTSQIEPLYLQWILNSRPRKMRMMNNLA
jgi:hypothetical protein